MADEKLNLYNKKDAIKILRNARSKVLTEAECRALYDLHEISFSRDLVSGDNSLGITKGGRRIATFRTAKDLGRYSDAWKAVLQLRKKTGIIKATALRNQLRSWCREFRIDMPIGNVTGEMTLSFKFRGDAEPIVFNNWVSVDAYSVLLDKLCESMRAH